MRVRVQVAPKRPPRYVSVLLDRGPRLRRRLKTLHSFGEYSFEAVAQAELYKAACDLAVTYYRRAISANDQDAIFATFGSIIGEGALRQLLDAAKAEPPDTRSTKRLRKHEQMLKERAEVIQAQDLRQPTE